MQQIRRGRRRGGERKINSSPDAWSEVTETLRSPVSSFDLKVDLIKLDTKPTVDEDEAPASAVKVDAA